MCLLQMKIRSLIVKALIRDRYTLVLSDGVIDWVNIVVRKDANIDPDLLQDILLLLVKLVRIDLPKWRGK